MSPGVFAGDSFVNWTVSIAVDKPFSPPQVEGCVLRLKHVSLDVLSREDQAVIEEELRLEAEARKEGINAPMPKHIQEFIKAKEEFKTNILNLKVVEKANGCALQVCIYDDEIKKRRKFVLGTYSNAPEGVDEQSLNLFFDEEQISNLTLEAKGRSFLNKKYCAVIVHGEVYAKDGQNMTLSELRNRAKKLEENEHKIKIEAVKQMLKESGAPTPRQRSEQELEERRKRKREEDQKKEEDCMEDHSEAREFVRQGVKILNIFVGHGRKAQRGDRVTVAYKGKLDPDKNHAFDKTSLRNPYSFRVGSRKVIKGINIGVEGMTLHAKRELIIPPEKGFGATGIPEKVPPNATLFYDLELVGLIPKKKVDKEIVEQNQLTQKGKLDKMRKQQKEFSTDFTVGGSAPKKMKQQ
ncbi:hypothetical protein AKO1_014663 [Acrasis kona]|uniref:peptidylprolyl isomerase n=1 Tax=Acrasis kona TaxID=1008807 RepID=A0AAW2Z0M6_9EUKA